MLVQYDRTWKCRAPALLSALCIPPCTIKSENTMPSPDSVGTCRATVYSFLPSSRVLSFVSSASPNWLEVSPTFSTAGLAQSLLFQLFSLTSWYSPSSVVFSVPEFRRAGHLTLSSLVLAVPSLQRDTSRCSANICCMLWANVPRWRPCSSGGLRCWGARVIWWVSRSAFIPKQTRSRHALDSTEYKATQKAIQENWERAQLQGLCDLLTAPGQGEEKSNGIRCWIRLVLGHICANPPIILP